MAMIKTLWIKDAYLQQILQGRKTVEVRVAYSNIARLGVGDQLRFNDQYLFVIRRIGRYANFADLLAHENPQAIAPGLSRKELMQTLRTIYPAEKESLGVIALEISPIA